jgi:hypothetical protein
MGRKYPGLAARDIGSGRSVLDGLSALTTSSCTLLTILCSCLNGDASSKSCAIRMVDASNDSIISRKSHACERSAFQFPRLVIPSLEMIFSCHLFVQYMSYQERVSVVVWNVNCAFVLNCFFQDEPLDSTPHKEVMAFAGQKRPRSPDALEQEGLRHGSKRIATTLAKPALQVIRFHRGAPKTCPGDALPPNVFSSPGHVPKQMCGTARYPGISLIRT